MAIGTVPGGLAQDEIVALSKRHTLFEWSAQNAIDPIPVDHAEGVYFYSPDGTRYLDFNSQLMSVNIGHGDQRVIGAIKAQLDKLAYANPFMAHEPRALLGRKLAEICPATSTPSSSPTAVPRRTRTPSSSRVSTPGARRSSPATGRTTVPRARSSWPRGTRVAGRPRQVWRAPPGSPTSTDGAGATRSPWPRSSRTPRT